MDVVVGSALMLIVFLGIAGVFKISVDVVTNNKSRAGAIALANERLEYIRSLAYAPIGTLGGVPPGLLSQSETVVSNAVSYTRRTLVQYADDPADGVGASDLNGITADYKVVRVDVAWNSRTGARHVTLVTRVTPQNGLETAIPGGTLAVTVLDAALQSVLNAQVHIVNPSVSPAVDITTYTNVNGAVSIIGAPAGSGYQITVSKNGYNTDQTYDATAENTNPSPGPLTVSDNQTTSGTFRIDLLAAKTIYTFTQVSHGEWNETMSNDSNIATSTNVSVATGIAKLSGAPGSYPSYGEMQSIAIGPPNLVRWKTLSWIDSQPAQTELRYRIYDGNGTNLIPNSEIPGNSAGFATSSSSVDLSHVATSTYPMIRIGTTFASSDASTTPHVDSYIVDYDYGPLPLPYIQLRMQGIKTIGSGPGGTIYKYNANHNSGASAQIGLADIEWDTYSITADGAGYDIASSCNPQPEVLNPGSSAVTRLYFATHTNHSLLVDVKSAGVLVPEASVRLYKTGYDVTKMTGQCGQTFFGGLSEETYSISVSAPGYQTYDNSTVVISGTSRLSVTLNSN